MRTALVLSALFVAGLIAGCGGGGSESALGTDNTVTRSGPTLTVRTQTRPTATVPSPTAPTASVPAPPRVTVTHTAQTATVVQSTTVVQATTVVQVTPSSTPTETEASGVNPAAAAAAAAAASQDEESSTDWGWVAFGILAGAVLILGIVWFIRRRNARGGDGGDAPPLSA